MNACCRGLVAAWLFGVGLYGVVTSRHFVHLIGCLSVVQSATYVLLLAVGFRWDAGAPIFYTHPPGTPAVDPVVQALVLTDIVVGATVTALLLALALQVHKRRGTLDPDELRTMRNEPMTAASLLPLAGGAAAAGRRPAADRGHALPRRVPDVIAVLMALAVAGLCACDGGRRPRDSAPLVYWFGGWMPRDGLALGIGFAADPASAAIGAAIGLAVRGDASSLPGATSTKSTRISTC